MSTTTAAVVFLFGALSMAFAEQDPLVLTRDGSPLATIVVADQPLPLLVVGGMGQRLLTQQYAAEELQKYITKISGARLPIVTATAAPPHGALILVGRSALSEQYQIQSPAKPEGLRIVDVLTGKSRVLTTEYDTLPVWSPKGDQIIFTRYASDDRFNYDEFDIYTIRPDGSGIKRLTDSEGNDAHSAWSPDGNFILWSSSRFGYKDESPLVINQPQPYAELFIMDADGGNQRPLTDNHYEEGTPAWRPAVLQPE